MPPKKKTEQTALAQPAPYPPDLDNEAGVEAASSDLGIDTDQEPPDLSESFIGWWDAQDGERIAIQVRRLEPEVAPDPTTGEEKSDWRGYCGQVPPHRNDIENYIAQRWGGHVFLVQRTRNGYYTHQRTVRISGPPRLDTMPPKGGPAGSPVVSPSLSPVLSPDEKVDGVSLHGDEATFEARMARTERIRQNDSSRRTTDRLLEKLIEKALVPAPPPEPFRDINQLLAAVTAFKDCVAPSAVADAAGSNWIDVFRDAIKSFDRLVSVRGGTAGAPPALLPVAGRVAAGQLPEESPGDGAPDATHTNHIGRANMNIKDVAHAAIQVVVNAFILPKRPTAPEIVEILDANYPLEAAARAEVQSHKKYLWRQCVVSLAAYFQEHEKAAEEFNLFFDEVFDLYVQPDRELSKW